MDRMLDHVDSGVIQRMDLGKSRRAIEKDVYILNYSWFNMRFCFPSTFNCIFASLGITREQTTAD